MPLQPSIVSTSLRLVLNVMFIVIRIWYVTININRNIPLSTNLKYTSQNFHCPLPSNTLRCYLDIYFIVLNRFWTLSCILISSAFSIKRKCMTFKNSHSFFWARTMIAWWTWWIMSFVFKKKKGEGKKSDRIALGSYQSGSEKIK